MEAYDHFGGDFTTELKAQVVALGFNRVGVIPAAPGRRLDAYLAWIAADPGRGRFSNYAWGADYHDVMTPRLEALGEWLRALPRPVSYTHLTLPTNREV